MQVGPGPRVERCRAIVRIGEAGQVGLRSRSPHRRERINFGIGLDDDVCEQFAGAEVAELVHRRAWVRPRHVAIELLDVESERRARPLVVAPLAFAACEEPPGLFAGAARRLRVGDLEREAFSLGRHEISVGARRVPGIGVAVPVAAVEVEELRLEFLRARWVARPPYSAAFFRSTIFVSWRMSSASAGFHTSEKMYACSLRWGQVTRGGGRRPPQDRDFKAATAFWPSSVTTWVR